jgi:hypothetical protein
MDVWEASAELCGLRAAQHNASEGKVIFYYVMPTQGSVEQFYSHQIELNYFYM